MGRTGSAVFTLCFVLWMSVYLIHVPFLFRTVSTLSSTWLRVTDWRLASASHERTTTSSHRSSSLVIPSFRFSPSLLFLGGELSTNVLVGAIVYLFVCNEKVFSVSNKSEEDIGRVRLSPPEGMDYSGSCEVERVSLRTCTRVAEWLARQNSTGPTGVRVLRPTLLEPPTRDLLMNVVCDSSIMLLCGGIVIASTDNQSVL